MAGQLLIGGRQAGEGRQVGAGEGVQVALVYPGIGRHLVHGSPPSDVRLQHMSGRTEHEHRQMPALLVHVAPSIVKTKSVFKLFST